MKCIFAVFLFTALLAAQTKQETKQDLPAIKTPTGISEAKTTTKSKKAKPAPSKPKKQKSEER